MRKRAGDTLIEVTIAIGIFSMVAIAVVAVMNGGTSNSQTALETTLAREEIDTQAEALRFIQSAYIADKDADNAPKNTTFEETWSGINERIVIPSESAKYKTFNDIIENTSSCNVVYNDNNYKSFLHNHAFIINPKTMEMVRPNSDTDLAPFYPASTYPRLVMVNQISEGGNTLSDNLVDNSLTSELARVEGLYVLAVQDNGTTMMTDKKNENTEKSSAYIDFYIRTCWYGIGGDSSSNISTVIRLYNPDATATASKATGVWVKFDDNNATTKNGDPQSVFVDLGQTIPLPTNGAEYYWRYGYEFGGWSLNANGADAQTDYTAPSILTFNSEAIFYAIWKDKPYTLNFSIDANGGNTNGVTTNPPSPVSAKANEKTCIKLNKNPSRDHYSFLGFKLDNGATVHYNGSQYCFQNPAYPGSPEAQANSTAVTLITQWKPVYYIKYDTKSSWTIAEHNCASDTRCDVSSERPTRSGYEFKGWCTKDTNNESCPNGGTVYQPGDHFAPNPSNVGTHLHAMWKARNETITVKLSFSSGDCDSHVEGQKSDNTLFHAYYGNMIGSDVSGLTIAQLDHDYTKGGTETFTINTLGGKNYYYYVHNYSGCNLNSSNTYVTVSGETFSPITFYSNNAPGYGGDWNVFAYKDGRIVSRQTHSSSPETSY